MSSAESNPDASTLCGANYEIMAGGAFRKLVWRIPESLDPRVLTE